MGLKSVLAMAVVLGMIVALVSFLPGILSHWDSEGKTLRALFGAQTPEPQVSAGYSSWIFSLPPGTPVRALISGQIISVDEDAITISSIDNSWLVTYRMNGADIFPSVLAGAHIAKGAPLFRSGEVISFPWIRALDGTVEVLVVRQADCDADFHCPFVDPREPTIAGVK